MGPWICVRGRRLAKTSIAQIQKEQTCVKQYTHGPLTWRLKDLDSPGDFTGTSFSKSGPSVMHDSVGGRGGPRSLCIPGPHKYFVGLLLKVLGNRLRTCRVQIEACFWIGKALQLSHLLPLIMVESPASTANKGQPERIMSCQVISSCRFLPGSNPRSENLVPGYRSSLYKAFSEMPKIC